MDIQAELYGHYINLKAVGGIEPYVTQKQVQAIASIMGQAVPDREERIAVLRCIAGQAVKEITGQDLVSTKNITGKMATYLIDQLRQPHSTPWKLSDYGKELLERTKTLVEVSA